MKKFCLIALSAILVLSLCSCATVPEDETVIPEKGSDIISFDGVVEISTYSFPESKSYRRTYSDPEIIGKFVDCIGNLTLYSVLWGDPGEGNGFGIHITCTYDDGTTHWVSLLSTTGGAFIKASGSSWYRITEEEYNAFAQLLADAPGDDDGDDSQVAFGTVQLLEETSDTQESSYRIGAEVSSTDFSSIGPVLADKITEEWKRFDSMSPEQAMVSSHAWGTVYVNSDTWEECEESIGVTINNPIESLDWLNKTGYFGDESADPSSPVTHVQTTAYAMRELSRLSVTAGYNRKDVQVTLTATLSAEAGTIGTGCIYKGYATFEQSTATTESGIPVLIVTTYRANNTGYYLSDYFDPTAYWVQDNVFYTLRISGEATAQGDIKSTLNRILAEI